MTPTVARALWLALLDNAARIVVEADALFPSPRAQSLVVIAQEEVGKLAQFSAIDRASKTDPWVGESFEAARRDSAEAVSGEEVRERLRAAIERGPSGEAARAPEARS